MNAVCFCWCHGELTLKAGSHVARIAAPRLLDMLVWEPITLLDMSEDLRAWCLLPNYQFTNEALSGMKPAESEGFKDRQQIPNIALRQEDVALLERQMQLIATALQNREHVYRTELAQSYFKSLMLEIGNMLLQIGEADEDADGIETRRDMILRSFLKLVWKYYRKEHNVDFYAGRLCLSSKHLSRVVREKLGKTPYGVIRDELIQRAVYLLKDTNMSVQEIAGDLHFSETASFCKFFKKHHGVSPTVFRRM